MKSDEITKKSQNRKNINGKNELILFKNQTIKISKGEHVVRKDSWIKREHRKSEVRKSPYKLEST